MYTSTAHSHMDTESREASWNQVLGACHSPDSTPSFPKKHVQLAVLICRHWGSPPPLQVLDVNCARDPGQHQGHRATAGLLRIPHDGHGHKPAGWERTWLGKSGHKCDFQNVYIQGKCEIKEELKKH